MPNPSTIAMEDEINEANAQTILSAFQLTKENLEIEVGLETVPDGTSDEILKLLEARDLELDDADRISAVFLKAYTVTTGLLDEREAMVQALTKTVTILSGQNAILEESRDRARAYNCDSVEEIRQGRRIAEASARAIRAGIAYETAENEGFESGEGVGDAVLQETADAAASLERLLIDGGYLEA